MPVLRKTLLVTLVCMVTSAPFDAQAPQPSATVPRLVPVAGMFTPVDGQPPAPVETVTLSLYAEQTGGTPIWEETQSVPVDASGRYHLLLGASLPEGLPLDLFASGEARWLGIRFARPGEGEARRARLTSVPYALRAADAETLGGRPASAYLLAPPDGAGRDPEMPGTPSLTTTTTVVTPNAINPGLTNAVAKYLNNADAIGPSILYESGQNLGIGTGSSIAVSPSGSTDRLNVRFTDTTGALTGISLRNDGNTTSSYSGLLFYDQNGDLAQFQGFNNVTHEYRFNNIARVSPGGALNGSINFMIGGASRFFVGTDGRIGIGTTNPFRLLSVVGATGEPGGGLFSTYTDLPTAGGLIDGLRARGTVQAPSAVSSGDLLASFGGYGYNSNSYTRAASMNLSAAGNWSNVSTPTRIEFHTANISGVALERMRITETGNVGIGTFPPATRLQVFGDVRVGTGSMNGCIQRFDATAIAGSCASDRRFKREITSFGAVLQAVAALRPVHYYWRATEFPERHFGDGQSYGLIAQEVEEVLPDLVVTNADGYKAVDYSKLPLLTVQAIKELKAENDELKAHSSAMQSRIAELERVMKQLLTDRSRF